VKEHFNDVGTQAVRFELPFVDIFTLFAKGYGSATLVLLAAQEQRLETLLACIHAVCQRLAFGADAGGGTSVGTILESRSDWSLSSRKFWPLVSRCDLLGVAVDGGVATGLSCPGGTAI
jgi:hypothetical protein